MGRLGVISAVILTAIFTMYSLMPNGKKDVLQKLEDRHIEPKIQFITYLDSLQIGFVEAGDPSKPTLLLIHGSPGDWSAWENIIANDSIRAAYFIIAVDRAGYGTTTVPPQADLKSQADLVWYVLKSLHRMQDIAVVGHSYGGAVVEQLLVDHPVAFSMAVYAAGTLSPDLMEPRWYNKVADWRLIKAILSKELKASNIEMVGLPASLRLLEGQIDQITTPIIFIQGKKDILVPHETTDYYKLIKPTGVKYIIVDDMNHFIPWSDPYLITDAVLGKIDRHKYPSE